MQNIEEIYEEQDIVQEAMDNFSALLADTSFARELELLGIGRFQFLLRKQMIAEFKGLYIALWRLALARSFPGVADAMFSSFLHGYLLKHKDKAARHIAQRAREYWGMILPGGDSDFTAVARHIISFMEEPEDNRALTLKVALHIRKIYCFLFERLI